LLGQLKFYRLVNCALGIVYIRLDSFVIKDLIDVCYVASEVQLRIYGLYLNLFGLQHIFEFIVGGVHIDLAPDAEDLS
jgi:hypothetical protein